MYYDAELSFFRRLVEKIRIQSHIVSNRELPDIKIDLGLRRYLGREHEYSDAAGKLPVQTEENTIYRFTDNYFCSYMFLILPETQGELSLVLGPYLTFDARPEVVLQKAEKAGLPLNNYRHLENFYTSIPYLADDAGLMISLTTLAESLWGTAGNYKITDLSLVTENDPVLMPEEKPSEDSILQMELMQKRYDFENELMDRVSKGLWHRARLLLTSMNRQNEQRLTDLLRNQKNYCIICNTLMRKAAEKGGVHPLYLDRISSYYAQQIELMASVREGQGLIEEMIQNYCRLVRRHSLKDYSPLIQKVLLHIDTEISSDLKLTLLAKQYSVSPEYLSTLFHKETGKTLTAYVNDKRLELGASLLRTTKLQVQSIAEYCGFPDAGYFAKLFRKHYGMSPKAYREKHEHH